MNNNNNLVEDELKLLPYQESAAAKIEESFRARKPFLFTAPARTGKTYAPAVAIRNLQKSGDLVPKDGRPFSVLILTVKSVKIQTRRVYHRAGVKHFVVAAYTEMSRKFGSQFIEWQTMMDSTGELDKIPIWREDTKPDIILLDECQKVRNHATLSSKVVKAAIKQGIPCYLISASPFTRLNETQVHMMALRLTNEKHWLEYAQAVAGPRISLNENSPTAMRRLTDILVEEGKFIKYESIKYKHRCKTRCVLIDFDSDVERQAYNDAFEEFLRKLREAGEDRNYGSWSKKIVALQKFQQKSELIRAPKAAKIGYEKVRTEKKQVIIAFNYVDSLRAAWKSLRLLGVPQNKISFIVGGQKEEERQNQVDRFQAGEVDYILLTLKSGGVGLSLHHEHPNARPRYTIIPPTWSPYDCLQVLGRAHGPTSESRTEQDIVWYRGTVEERVAQRVESRLSCLAEMIGRRESWVDVFLGETDKELEDHLEEVIDEKEKTEESEDNMFLAVDQLQNED